MPFHCARVNNSIYMPFQSYTFTLYEYKNRQYLHAMSDLSPLSWSVHTIAVPPEVMTSDSTWFRHFITTRTISGKWFRICVCECVTHLPRRRGCSMLMSFLGRQAVVWYLLTDFLLTLSLCIFIYPLLSQCHFKFKYIWHDGG